MSRPRPAPGRLARCRIRRMLLDRVMRPAVLSIGLAAALAAPIPPATSADDAAPPACRDADVATSLSGYDDWARTLLDRSYRLLPTYVPPDLVPVASAGLPGGGLVRRLVVPDLTALVRAARAAGIPLAAVSGYRSYGSQAGTFAQWVRKKGYAGALRGSARAGHSEHQLGTSIDFTSAPGVKPWYFVWFESATARWLASTAWRYGFVASYPAGKSGLTCYQHEPWHYRYVGRPTAAAVRASGTTLREYLWSHRGAVADAEVMPDPSAAWPRWRTIVAERG